MGKAHVDLGTKVWSLLWYTTLLRKARDTKQGSFVIWFWVPWVPLSLRGCTYVLTESTIQLISSIWSTWKEICMALALLITNYSPKCWPNRTAMTEVVALVAGQVAGWKEWFSKKKSQNDLCEIGSACHFQGKVHVYTCIILYLRKLQELKMWIKC